VKKVGTLKLVVAAGVLALAVAGCQGGIHGPQLFGGINDGAACPPGPKACPRNLYPEFPLPPGGPYLTTPANAGMGAGARAPMNLNLTSTTSSSNQELTVKTGQ
jgi:hypothetical protein